MKPHQVAHILDIGVSTVRAWSSQFAEFMSPSAQGGDGRYRDFTDHDVRVLHLINTMKRRSIPPEELHMSLSRLQADDWRDLPYLSEAPPTSAAVPVVPEAALTTQQALLLREIGDLRERVNELQARLDSKAESEAKLLREIGDMQAKLAEAQTELRLWREGRLKPD